MGRRHVAIAGQKVQPANINEQGSQRNSQGSESTATVIERPTQVQLLPAQKQSPTTGGGGMGISECRRFSKG